MKVVRMVCSGIIKWDPFEGNQQKCKCMAYLRDFPLIMVWVGNIMAPVVHLNMKLM